MSVVLTIKESNHGLWCICSGVVVLYDRLGFAHAVRLARGLAREEHVSSGQSVSVAMACADFTISLVRYEESVKRRPESVSLQRLPLSPRRIGWHLAQSRHA